MAGSSASVSISPPWPCPGPEITDELVRVLRRRLDEATLDVITVMLVRNCKLTPADVEVSSLPGFLRDSTAAAGTVAARTSFFSSDSPSFLLCSSSSLQGVCPQRCCSWGCHPAAGPGFPPWPGTCGRTCSSSCTPPSTRTATAETTSR